MPKLAPRPQPMAELPQTPQQVLRTRAEHLAQPLAAARDVEKSLQLLCFGLGVERYAIETRYVTHTRRAAAITPLPFAGAHVLGLANVLGDLLVVFDLRALFGVERVANGSTHFIILGTEQPEFAVAVDALESVETLTVSLLLDPTTAMPGGSRAFLRGVTRDALLVIDGSALLADERLYVDSP